MWTSVDQVLSSGTNLLLIVLVFRNSPGPVFGIFSFVLLAQGLLLGCVRAMVGEVLFLRIRSHAQECDTDCSHALALVLGSGALVALALAAAGVFVPDPLRGFLLAMVVAVPAVHVQDLQRYAAFARARPRTAVALDFVWLVTQVGVTAIVFRFTADPVYLVLSWAAGAAISGTGGLLFARWKPSCRGIRELVRQERGRAGSFLGDFVLSTGATQVAYLGLPAVLVITEFGLLQFTQTITRPPTNMLIVVSILTLGYFGRLRAPSHLAWRILLGAGVVNIVAILGFAGVVLMIPDNIGIAVLGKLWLQARPLVVLAAVAEAARVAAFPAVDFLKVFIAGVTLVRVRAVTSLISIVGLFVGAVAAGPRGALIALDLANLLALALWLLAVQAVRPQ
jgi:hypothetical protein